MEAFKVKPPGKSPVVLEYVTALSDVASTVNDPAAPAATDPKDPAVVTQVGASDTVKIAVADRPASPSGFSTRK